MERTGATAYLSRYRLAELTPYTISDKRAPLAQLERLGPATIDREEYALGFMCLAVPGQLTGTGYMTFVPYISPSGSASSSRRTPSGSLKYRDLPLSSW